MINMKKKILLSVLLIIAYTVISYAQTPKDFDKEVIKSKYLTDIYFFKTSS